VVPGDLTAVEVDISGRFTELEFRSVLETAVGREVIVAGRSWWIQPRDGFALVVPAILPSEVGGGVKVTDVGGRALLRGDGDSLPEVRRLLDVLSVPRELVRVRLYVVDELEEWGLSAAVDKAFSVGWDRGLVRSWDADFVLSVWDSQSALAYEWEGMAVDGVELRYADVSEIRLERYVSGESGQVFSSEWETVSAGFDLGVRAVRLPACWRVTGDLEVSDFRGAVGARTRRSIGIDIDVADGSLIRICRLDVERKVRHLGIQDNVFRVGADGSRGSYAVWLGLVGVDVESRLISCVSSPPFPEGIEGGGVWGGGTRPPKESRRRLSPG